MSLAGAAKSVIDLLRSSYQTRHLGLDGLTFEVISPASMTELTADRVTIFLYRLEQDSTRRHEELPPFGARGPRRRYLFVDLRFLLIVWVADPLRELQLIEECMEVLDANPVLSGPLLETTLGSWEPDTQLRVSLDHLPPEETLRLWDALTPSFRISVPYVIRTLRIAPVLQPDAPPVETSTRVYVPAVPAPEEDL